MFILFFIVQKGVAVWINNDDELVTVVVLFSVWIVQGAALRVWSLHVWACPHIQVCKNQHYLVEEEKHTLS